MQATGISEFLVVLLSPIKFPGKFLNILKCIALSLGVLENVVDDKEKKE